MAGRYALGIDLGGTNLKVGLVDQAGKILAALTCPTQAPKGPDHFVRQVETLTQSLLSSQKLERAELIGAGLGTPGPLNLETGTILKAANLPGWVNVPIKDMLSGRLGCGVVVENDANAAAFGEFWCGRKGQCRDLVLLTLGTGVGAGVVLDGSVLDGHFDNAGELGHMIVVPGGLSCPCGQRGCLEAYSSAGAITRRFLQALRDGGSSSLQAAAVDAREIARYAEQGDGLCARLWDEACYYLAIAIINIQHAYNPQLVLLGGGMAEAKAFLLDRVLSHVSANRWHLHEDLPAVELAGLGSDAGLIGAAGLAWGEFSR